MSAQRKHLGWLLQHVYKLLDHRESLRNCVCLEGAGHVLKSNLHRELGEPRAKAMKREKKGKGKRILRGCWERDADDETRCKCGLSVLRPAESYVL